VLTRLILGNARSRQDEAAEAVSFERLLQRSCPSAPEPVHAAF